MKKILRIIIGIIILLLLFIVACYSAFKLTDKPNDNENMFSNTFATIDNTNTQNIAENILDENVINTENTVNRINKNTENTPEKPTTNSQAVQKVPSSAIYETNSDVGTTDKKEEAINLVKAKWGEDDTVSFRCDSVTANGEYIIAVVSKDSASVKNYFKVNLEKQSVEVDY